MTLWHTALHVSDVEHSTEFYRDLADYEVVREFEADDGTRNHFVGDPDGDERDDAALQLSPVDGPVEPGDFNHVALEVEDVDATVADLDDALVDQGPETIPEFGLRVAFVEDPHGYGIELIEEL
jgi:lactoylglutathione lyase